MAAEEFAQEWYCSFEASIKGAYYAAELATARREGRVKPFKPDPALPVHTVWDLGKGPNMAIGFYQRTGTEIRKIDYWEGSGDDGLPAAARMLQEKGYVYGKHFAPHDIVAVEMGSEKTRIEIAKALGIRFELDSEGQSAVPRLSVDDGIHAGKLMFSRMWINDERCQPFIDSVTHYHREWDEKRGMFREVPAHDWSSHGCDEYRYAALVEDQMRNEVYHNPSPTTGLVGRLPGVNA